MALSVAEKLLEGAAFLGASGGFRDAEELADGSTLLLGISVQGLLLDLEAKTLTLLLTAGDSREC